MTFNMHYTDYSFNLKKTRMLADFVFGVAAPTL